LTPPPSGRRISAAIFDLDGLLLDTEPLYFQATTEVLARYGRTLERDVLRRHIGIPSVETMRLLANHYTIPVPPAELNADRHAILDRLLPTAAPRPGARELTDALRAAHVPIAVGTSSTADTLALKLEPHRDWFAHFDCIVTSDDVPRGKPHPDIFLRAAELLGQPPESCVVFEDARSGVEAARAAGMAVVMVPTEGVDPDGLEPDELLSSLDDFDPRRWGFS
jgi:pseudouridine-5'-monophosphatase